MTASPSRRPDTDPPGGFGYGLATDWQFEALLAAGVLACAGGALAMTPPPGTPANGPNVTPSAVERETDDTPERVPGETDELKTWARKYAADGQQLLLSGRDRLMRLWNQTHRATWGEEMDPDSPVLRVYGTGIEREDGAGAGTSSWRQFDPTAGSPGSRVVVLVHGLDESGLIWDDLAPALAQAGLTPVRFDYPNDQSISTTTDQLASALRELERAGVNRVDLVGHSMGGLVARDLLTRPDLYAGDATGAKTEGHLPAVSRLIMVGSPHRGSALTGLLRLSEAREQLERRIEGTNQPGDGWIHSTRDGRGEAGVDLAAGSAFLTELNARPLPSGVKMTNIVGRMVSSDERDRLRNALSRGLANLLDSETASTVTGYVDDALDGLGDGLVSADAMVLEGVEDTVEVKANHRSMLRRMRVGGMTGTDVPPAVPIIVNRLTDAE